MKQGDLEKNTKILRFVGFIEKAGNKLPHPVILFCYGIVFTIVVSVFLSLFGITVTDPKPGSDALIEIKSLLNKEGIAYILTSAVPNFVNFAPLGTVLVAMLGIGIAERSGLIEASLKSLIKVAPKSMVTSIVVFVGVLSNLAGELGYIVIIPIGALIFYGLGRHPLAGLAAAFSGVSGGYSANLLIGTIDPVLAGLSQESARMLDAAYVVGVQSNWYFMLFSTFLVTIMGTLVTTKIVEPVLGKYDDSQLTEKVSSDLTFLSDVEKKGLKVAGLVSLLFSILLFISVFPGKGILLNQETMKMADSPFFDSIVAFVFLFFSINGIVYGYIVKSYTNAKDVVDSLSKTMASLSFYIVLAFFMAQFIDYFKYTNLGLVLAVSLSNVLQSMDLHSSILLTGFIFVVGLANLFMGSASAKWALLSPIFIPMFMILGISPEVVQVAYRIGDSSTNIISPLMSYVGVILYAGQKYIKDFGFGNLLSIMLPYSIVFLVVWSIVFYIWAFVFGIPVGPESTIEYVLP